MSIFNALTFCKYCRNLLTIPGDIVLDSHLSCLESVENFNPNDEFIVNYHGFELPQLQIEFLLDLEDMIKAVDRKIFDSYISKHGIPLIDLDNPEDNGHIPQGVVCCIDVDGIEALVISDISILLLPNSYKNLTTLKRLILFKTKIAVFPDEISTFTNLEELVLSQCPISKIPDTIRSLSNLKSLTISNTKIIRLPILEHLIHLEELYLEENKLFNFPKWIKSLFNLRWLNIYGNCIKSYPLWLLSLPNLRAVNDIILPISPIQKFFDDHNNQLNNFQKIVVYRIYILDNGKGVTHSRLLKYFPEIPEIEFDDILFELSFLGLVFQPTINRYKLLT